MWYKMSSNKVMILIIAILSIYILAQKQCASDQKTVSKSTKITIERDTIYQIKIDTFYLQTEKYKTVYVPKNVPNEFSESKIKTKKAPKATELYLFEEAREYLDTLENDDLEIYSYNLLKGELLSSSLSYKLKVPREIKTTTTIEHPKTYRSGLYGFAEAGGNQERFSNIGLGLQYNRKGKWFISYRMNFNQLSTVTHNVGIGVRIN
ncbi:hypothetical protein [Aquimarina litoralis]|uniref:hypothetical protein n=1 Tax=Aquimarina litoralis TaxID=584605 RepID=UPI001C57B28A|nr:hypothetical protein [Aquimarina litoralis]MBW1295343.1 hypothetical protein [Aquimarina litoralis]